MPEARDNFLGGEVVLKASKLCNLYVSCSRLCQKIFVCPLNAIFNSGRDVIFVRIFLGRHEILEIRSRACETYFKVRKNVIIIFLVRIGWRQ